jgi:Stigma-specific protein, Stig1
MSLLLGLHCAVPKSSSGGAQQVSGVGPKVPPLASCLGNACVKDLDCAKGYRCNTALDVPTCEALYCGDPGTICSAADVCKTGMQCHDNQCNPCNICGDQCEVDFAADTQNCGACGVKTPESFVCAQGKVRCPDGQTDCGGRCTDLLTDKQNCGACAAPTPETFLCTEGAVVCPDGQTDCGGRCTDLLTDKKNCGVCGRVAQVSEICSGGKISTSCKASERACPGQPCKEAFSDTNCGNACGKPRACASSLHCAASNYGERGETFACQTDERSTDRSKTCAAVCSAKGLVCTDYGWTETAGGLDYKSTFALYRKAEGSYVGRSIACGSLADPVSGGYPFAYLECRCSAP